MSLTSKLVTGAAILLSPFLYNSAKAQDTVPKEKYKTKIGLSLDTSHESWSKETFGTVPGLYLGMSKKIKNELYASLNMKNSWKKNEEENVKQHGFEISPYLEWRPVFGKDPWFTIGGGIKYKSLSLKEIDGDYEENYDGLGLTVFSESRINFGENFAIILGLYYDKVKTSDEDNLGSTGVSILAEF